MYVIKYYLEQAKIQCMSNKNSVDFKLRNQNDTECIQSFV